MAIETTALRYRILAEHAAADFAPPIRAGRMAWLFAAFTALSLTVFVRLLAIEIHDGPDYRAVAAEPIVRKHSIAAMRGRILAGDGTVLAYDQPVEALTLNYRWLEEPANSRWLRRTARSRLSISERPDAKRLIDEEHAILQERHDLAQRLMELCGLSEVQWRARTERIQRRVESISASVNSRHQAQREADRTAAEQDSTDSDSPLAAIVGRSIVDALFALDHPPADPPVVIAEEVSEHVVFEGLPVEAVAEIEANAPQYPGVKLVRAYRRAYPQGDLAAHLLGYLGRVNAKELASSQAEGNSIDPEDWRGRSGLERQYESLLKARRGLVVDELDVRGVVHQSTTVREPANGHDLVITLDTALQRSAQSLLDQAVARRLPSGNRQLDTAAGGAVIAIDVHNGALLAAASAPRFDPNVFTQDGSTLIAGWLTDPSRPLFDRTVQMALPPGSVFKIVSAAAIVASGVDPRAPVDCQGYLHQPDALRCAIYRRYGIGHGPVTLIDALARSCNVYFFQHAEQLGPAPILDWARRFGLGAVTGVDLPGEAAGRLPVVNDVAPDVARQTRTDALPIAIGQSTTTTTPLQIVRIAAAIANGGKLVRPHVAQRIALSPEEEESKSQRVEKSKSLFDTATFRRFDPPRPIVGLDERMVSAIRDGMRQAVADEQGTAHATVDLAAVSIAGKTGTAETGPGKPEHAWFVGYAPADQPRVAFVVVIEHAGNADTAAGPVAQHFVERLSQLGYFSRTKR